MPCTQRKHDYGLSLLPLGADLRLLVAWANVCGVAERRCPCHFAAFAPGVVVSSRRVRRAVGKCVTINRGSWGQWQPPSQSGWQCLLVRAWSPTWVSFNLPLCPSSSHPPSPYGSRYLYLLFCEDDVLSLDDWVFNTEAHPLPVNHTNFKASVQ